MNTKEELDRALKEAMRSGDEPRKRTIRMVLANIKMAEIDKGIALDEAGVLTVLQKEMKSQQESIADAQRAGRPDLVASAQEEIAILESFLPRPFSQGELEALARQAIAEVQASSVREMGQVMKVLMPRLQGRATGEQASQAVRQLLQ
ncbi:MAG: hypothetical protein A2W36_04555 [Chloroflexi bacterium RBG_16_58_14]|nr:MAG: hypothetical protein A2W36_04555 [Chloroflexi bacterium RBG_16_58_14]